MKFKIPQADFSRALTACGKSILARANLPILSNLLIRAEGKDLEVLSTNLEAATRAKLKGEVGEGGEVTVNGKMLLEFVSQLPQGELVFEKLGEGVTVSTNGYSGRFATLPPEEFPAIPKIEKGISFEVAARDFVDASAKVAFSAAQDEGRPILTGILCEVSKNKMKMVATDGYRLSFKEVAVASPKVLSSLKANVPARAFAEVARIISDLGLVAAEESDKGKVKMVSLTIADALNQINFKIKDVPLGSGRDAEIEFTSRLIEGEFPNWQKIIPASFNTQAKIEKGEFVKLIRIASIFARDSGNIVKLKFEPQSGKSGIFSVSATSSQVGSSDAMVDVEITGKGGEIAFNFRYILEVLSVMEGEEINFEMNESLNPGKITSEGSPNFFHIVMPVRLQT